jgi:glycosyltransferase involved in cell wall biosynthesis
MNILFVSPGHPEYDAYPIKMGGTQHQIYGVARELVKLGHEVYALRRYHGIEHETIDGVHFIGVKTHFSDEIVSVVLFSRKAAEKIKEISPDVINLSERFSAYFPSKLDIPKIFFTANYDAFAFYSDFAASYNPLNRVFFPLKNRLEEGIMRRSDRVIALNREIAEYLRSRGIVYTTVVPRGIEPDLYRDEGEGGYVLYAGRLSMVKGVDCLIRAYLNLGEELKRYRLLLVGSGPDERKLKKLASGRKGVEFIPWVEHAHLREYLAKCSTFVLPSQFETFGIVALEAMASAKTVIASEVIGPKDIITHGEDGLLFERGNDEALAEMLRRTLSDEALRKRLGKNARKTAERYSFSNIVRRLIKLYEEVL